MSKSGPDKDAWRASIKDLADCELLVRPTGDWRMLGTPISVSKERVYQAMHAVNQKDWKSRGLIFILDAEGDTTEIGFLLSKEDYTVVAYYCP